MNALRKDAVKTPISHIIIITLFAVGGASLPLDKLFGLFIDDTLTAKLVSGITVRAVLTVIAAYFIFKYGFEKALKTKPSGLALLVVVPSLAVAVNNFPIIGVCYGNVTFQADAVQLVLYVIFCASVGFYEEFVFRGLVFPLCYRVVKKGKYGVFWAVALSSAVFGASHLINVFAGAGIGATALQVGYSFLIGAMCAISTAATKNLFVAATLHSVYDIGGLALSYVAVGNQWDFVTVVITALLGIVVAIYMTAVCLKIPTESLEKTYFAEEFDSETSTNN